jgi:hypothetical protein
MVNRGLRYTIAGEGNPYWILAEPILLRIWAHGITKASLVELHITNVMSLVISAVGFAAGALLRAAVVGVLFSVIYLAIPEVIERGPSASWIYQGIAIVLIISSAVFVLGERLFWFIGECLLYLLFTTTNMIPLRLLASGLRNERYLAQLIAKTSFMGMYIVQTVGALPTESQAEWERVFDLYKQSNTPDARAELEELAAEWSKR